MPKCHQFQYKIGCKHGKKISTNAFSISAIYEYQLDRYTFTQSMWYLHFRRENHEAKRIEKA